MAAAEEAKELAALEEDEAPEEKDSKTKSLAQNVSAGWNVLDGVLSLFRSVLHLFQSIFGLFR